MKMRYLADYDPKQIFSKNMADEACQHQLYLQKNMLSYLETKFESHLFERFHVLLNELSQKFPLLSFRK